MHYNAAIFAGHTAACQDQRLPERYPVGLSLVNYYYYIICYYYTNIYNAHKVSSDTESQAPNIKQ